MPPPSKRLGVKRIVPEVMMPSWKRIAQPVMVPRSRARTERCARAACTGIVPSPLASGAGAVRVARAMVASERGSSW
jgi:hypothetical protein